MPHTDEQILPPSIYGCALYRRGCVGQTLERNPNLCTTCEEHHPYLLRGMIADDPAVKALYDEVMEQNERSFACVSRREAYFDAPWTKIVMDARIRLRSRQQEEETGQLGLEETQKNNYQKAWEREGEDAPPAVQHGWPPIPSYVLCSQVDTPDSLCTTCVGALDGDEKLELRKYFEQSTWTLKQPEVAENTEVVESGKSKKSLRERASQIFRKPGPKKRDA
ncbi:hypothetical protein N0V83_006327 [Neocucurbitaria cava]|uniref:Uncharacterized protein n=1 Tax=Neocucurbitaria cava TaxID=798079 RepID=A0A9W9CM40_9PLEO|nr:hypothetical protein N0V83_006327 [Neocucurbitaria cava]